MDLHIDIQRCSDQYIEFPDSAWPSVFTSWIMGSYLVPFLLRSPILSIYGPTGSGKGQVMDQIDRLAYRGKKLINPTPAVLYWQADRWRPTVGLDELQDKDKDGLRELLNIVKGTFDGTPVQRCVQETGDVKEYSTRGFMAVSFKDRFPPEDVQNRAVCFIMRQNGAHKELIPDDSPEHQELRGRLLGLRLKALTDLAFIEGWQSKVREASTPEVLGFDRRPRDIAVSLLLPALMCKQEAELIETIRRSTVQAREEENEGFTAQVQHAVEELWDGPRYISVIVLRKDLTETLRADGVLRDNGALRTKKVTDALKLLGYELLRRHANIPHIDQNAPRNQAAYETSRARFAVQGE